MAAWAQSIGRWRLVPCGMLLCALLTGCASRGPAPEDAIVVTQTAAACRAYFALFHALDHAALRFQPANLPEAAQRRLSPSAAEYCGYLLRDSDLADAARR